MKKIWQPSYQSNYQNIKINSKIILHQDYATLYRLKLEFMTFSATWSTEIDREVLLVRGNPAIALLFDPRHKIVLLNEQFRAGAFIATKDAWVIEPVAGVIEPGENPETTVQREAKEEAGCEVLRLEPIARYLPTPGLFAELVHLYCAEVNIDPNCYPQVHGLASEGEDIKVYAFSLEQAFSLLDGDYTLTASLIISLRWLQRNHERISKQWS